jgi:site-specific DNA-cytosine methylase
LSQGTLRTGGVFHALLAYVQQHQAELFQWENVVALAKQPKDKQQKTCGPSNLSSAVHLLRKAGLWSHVWHLTSDEFGSGQSRARLWGSSFQLSDLHMDEREAHKLLDDMMAFCAGVETCSADEYLLEENSEDVIAARASAAAAFMSKENMLKGDGSLSISALFATGGVVSVGKGEKRRKTALARAGASPTSQKWVNQHVELFEKMGEELSLLLNFLVC